jgi:hypothetical protein
MSPLLALPVELLNRIISFIAKPTSLTSLNQTCKLLQELTEGPLYKSVLLRNNRASNFATTISRNPERKALVKEITVFCERKPTEEWEVSACTQASLFAEFQNLEVLILSSGYLREDEDESRGEDRVLWATDQNNVVELFKQAGLSKPIDERIWTKLRSCSLHFLDLDGQGWPCIFSPAIFLVASLENLTIGNCRFTDEDGKELLNSPHRGQTALRKLELEGCYIHHTAVFNFLCAPKALTHLTLDHEPWVYDIGMGVQPTLSDRAEDYMEAFRQQTDSLQFLHIGNLLCREIVEGVFNFSTFPELKEVQYDDLVWFLNEAKCLRLIDEGSDDDDEGDDEDDDEDEDKDEDEDEDEDEYEDEGWVPYETPGGWRLRSRDYTARVL